MLNAPTNSGKRASCPTIFAHNHTSIPRFILRIVRSAEKHAGIHRTTHSCLDWTFLTVSFRRHCVLNIPTNCVSHVLCIIILAHQLTKRASFLFPLIKSAEEHTFCCSTHRYLNWSARSLCCSRTEHHTVI